LLQGRMAAPKKTGRLGCPWPVVLRRGADNDEPWRTCILVTWRSWWRRPVPAASGRDETSLALDGRREGPPATGCGRRQAASVWFGVVDPMVASGCTGGVLVWHNEEATLTRLDRRACKAVVICRRGNRRRAAGRAWPAGLEGAVGIAAKRMEMETAMAMITAR
jgi:hypothetical protein